MACLFGFWKHSLQRTKGLIFSLFGSRKKPNKRLKYSLLFPQKKDSLLRKGKRAFVEPLFPTSVINKHATPRLGGAVTP
jgi:hypothetical protein